MNFAGLLKAQGAFMAPCVFLAKSFEFLKHCSPLLMGAGQLMEPV